MAARVSFDRSLIIRYPHLKAFRGFLSYTEAGINIYIYRSNYWLFPTWDLYWFSLAALYRGNYCMLI